MKSLNKIILLDIDYTIFDTQTFKQSGLTQLSLYEEILPVLESLSKFGELGIFSKGETKFQKFKLQNTGIEKYFQDKHIHIFEDKDKKLESVLCSYSDRKIYLIDDKLAVLFNAKKYNNSITTIWVDRGPYAQDKSLLKNFSPDLIVNSLNEIIPLSI
jgi:phosphoglycolate phosphatase-like HAD superfamily hydrolase